MNFAFVVPRLAATHRDPVVKQAIFVVERLFQNRKNLKKPVLDKFDNVILPPFPELLEKAKKKGQETAEELEKRRADGMQATTALILTLMSCCSWIKGMEIRDPRGGYLSVARMAELAELSEDRAERALQRLRQAGIVTFTKQHRELLADGTYKSTGPALRRFGKGFFFKCAGALLRTFKERVRDLLKRRDLVQDTSRRDGAGQDLRIARLNREMLRGRPAAPAAPQKPLAPRPSQALIDTVQAEDPERPYFEVLREAYRRAGIDTS